jgi:hypothetical protein
MAALIETAFRATLDVSPDLTQWTADLARFDARIATLTGRSAPRAVTPGVAATTESPGGAATPATVATAAACEGCPAGATTASVLVASDLRSRIDSLPAATSKLDN